MVRWCCRKWGRIRKRVHLLLANVEWHASIINLGNQNCRMDSWVQGPTLKSTCTETLLTSYLALVPRDKTSMAEFWLSFFFSGPNALEIQHVPLFITYSPDKWLFWLLKLEGCVTAESPKISSQIDLVAHLFTLLSHSLDPHIKHICMRPQCGNTHGVAIVMFGKFFLDSVIELLSFFSKKKKVMLEVLIFSSESSGKRSSAQSGTSVKCNSVTRHHFPRRPVASSTSLK